MNTWIITGVTSGIGKELAKLCIRKQIAVIGVGRNQEKLQKVQQELGALFTPMCFDVSDTLAWDAFAKKLQEENRTDIACLVNNAGQLPSCKRFDAYSLEEIQRTMQTNFLAAVYASKALLPILLKYKQPTIANVTSSAALASMAGTSLYSASKAALKAFTESMREELKGLVRVVLLCPGTTKTDVFRNQAEDFKSNANHIGMRADVMAKKIFAAIQHKKRRAVIGFDAKMMDFLYRYFPRSTPATLSSVLKKSKMDAYQTMYRKEKNDKNGTN